MIILAKYGTQTDFYFPLIKRGVVDFAVSADYTHSSGDVKVSKDGGAAATATNSPSAVTMGNTALWKITLTATEMQAAKIVVTIADAATKAVEDQMLVIHTYGNASAAHAFDLGTATQDINVAQISGDSTAADKLEAWMDGLLNNTAQAGAAGTITLNSGAVATDDYYNGFVILITGGTGVGQARLITDYVGSTKVASVTPNWATNPDNTSTFILCPAGALGLDTTALTNFKAMFDGTGYAGGTTRLKVDVPIKKNTALSAFPFFMVDSSDDLSGKTGLTVTATRMIDGAAFAACANSVSEVANGLYKIDLAASDLNGTCIVLKFTATGANPTIIPIITSA